MKKIQLLFLVLFCQSVYSQSNIESIIQDLDKKLIAIEAGKNKIDPSVSSNKKSPCVVIFNVEDTDPKGKTETESFEVGLADLSAQLLRGNTKSNVRYVEVVTKDRLQFIKYSKDGVFKDYVNKFELPVFDNDAAKALIDLIKSAIETCEKSADTCPKINAIGDAATQLKTLIGKVSVDDKQYDQQIEFDKAISTRVKLIVNETNKSKNSTSESIFDFGDFADNKIKLDVSGKQLKISIASRIGNIVQNTENGKCQNLSDDVTFFANDIEQAKCLVKALKSLITLARDAADTRIPAAENMNEALTLSAKNVQSFEQCGTNRKQEMTPQCLTTLKMSLIPTGDKKKEDWVYTFNFMDVNPSSIELKTSGNTLLVRLKTRENENYIRVFKNDELQNYDNEIAIPVPDAESAKLLMQGLKKAAKNCPQTVSSACGKTGAGALDCAIAATKEVKQAKLSIRQKLEKQTDNEYKLLLKVETEKESKTELITYDWNMKDIDTRRVEMKVSGKEIKVILQAKNNEKIIKINKSDKTEYTNKVAFAVDDIESGRMLKEIFQKTVEGN